MIIKKFILIFLSIIAKNVNTGRVHPNSHNFITLSTPNAGELADYYFSMIFDSPIPTGGKVEITFPSNQYKTGLGLPGVISAFDQDNTAISTVVNDRTLIFDFANKEWKRPYTIIIKDIINPLKVGGTGNFKVK